MKKCSELASIQTYKPFDIVYVANRGQASPVRIILSGRCSIIQYLNINVSLSPFIYCNVNVSPLRVVVSIDFFLQINVPFNLTLSVSISPFPFPFLFLFYTDWP